MVKTRIFTIGTLVQLLCVLLTWGTSFRAVATNAVITDDKGMRTSVTGIRAHRWDGCKYTNLAYWADVATETNTEWDSIFLSLNDDSYRVEIPLDIIKTVTRLRSGAKGTPEQWAVVLSDDTRLVGKPTTFEDFKAKAELGDFSIPWRSISQMTFASPKTTYQARPHDIRALNLYLADTEKLSLMGATFIYDERNRNGCFVGFGYQSSVPFVTDGGAKYDITWDKIRELRFDVVATRALGLCNGLYTGVVHLVSPSGTEYTGSFGDLAASSGGRACLSSSGTVRPVGVEAVARIGAFNLHTIIPFASRAKRLTVDKQ